MTIKKLIRCFMFLKLGLHFKTSCITSFSDTYIYCIILEIIIKNVFFHDFMHSYSFCLELSLIT